jgi:2',3'-cyclic-nucleotide 2'-phosphodiesterase / 3'-nucleotidase / 5'-nucleotidase
MKSYASPVSFTRFIAKLASIAVMGLAAATIAHAQNVVVGWNFTDLDGNFDTGTPVNFTVGGMSIANSFGTVTTPINASSASSGYTGASGTGNIGNAVNNATFSTSTSPYTSVTLTPATGYSLQITQFNFGMRSTSTGATVYALYSSADNYTAPIFTGSNTANSTWTLKTSPAFTLNGALNTTVTLRLYTYGGGSSAVSGTINTRLDDIAITVAANASVSPTNPTAIASANPASVLPGQTTTLTVTVTPGTNPDSTGLTVTGDLSAIGGSATQAFTAGPNNTFTYTATVPANTAFGNKTLNFSIQDAQSRSGTASLNLGVFGNLTIFHTNDTHARVTPHKWIVPQHSGDPQTQFESVGGAAYTGAKILSLVTGQPDALVLDGGDISEGNPVGDWNGPGNPVGSFGNGTSVEYYKLLDTKLRAIPGRGGRGLDAMVVGNHDIRDISYLNNMKSAAQTNFPILSINICNKGTHTPYFQQYVVLNVNGHKIGVVGYTTETSDSPETAVNTLIDVVKCDWSSTDSTKIHFADIVNDLRNNQGCDLVILLTHDGHSDLCTSSSAGSTPILVDTPAAKLPEIAVTGHWHTYCDSVWQPSILNYKTIFTEAGSFEHYVGELRVDGSGKYLSSTYYPLRNSDITPDPDIANLIQTRIDQYNATNPTYGLNQVIGYTSDDLLLDNKMKWWSSDEYPWSGNNTAGNWICDGLQWKAAALFGQCDLCIESGGGVRSDIPAGPITYTALYETYPWADDTIYLVKMTGQEIWNYVQQHGCDVGLSRGWFVTAYDGNPTSITYNGQPIDLAHSYEVAISNFMYLHDSVPFTDPNPQYIVTGYPNGYLARTALVDFTSQYPQNNPYSAGSSRYSLNTEFSGGYRAVVLMMNDADSKTVFDDGFIRLLSANPETLQHRGTVQVPTSLVNADGSLVATNRLTEIELYRSYLGFKTGALHPGDIIETWGKGSFFGGDPEFVDQEGIYADGVEFKVVGHDDSLAKPAFMPSIASFWDDVHKNHYVKFLARKTGTSTVADQNGQSLTIEDVTAFTAKSLPGNTGDLLLITGIPTSESFALRFRSDSAVLASSAGISDFPPTSTVSSHVDPIPATTTASSVALSATAVVNSSNVFSLAPVADASVSSANPTSNTNSTTLFVESATSGFGDERSWLRFDLSSLPAGATITSASLQLFCWSTAGLSLPTEVHGVSDDTWTESGITWNTQPALGAALDSQTLVAGTTNVTYSWNVTSFAQAELGGDKLVSLAVKPVTEGSSATPAPSYRFDSKEFGSNAPVLQVTVQSAGPVVTVSQVQYFYRYSADNSSWGAWTASATATTAPYAATFNFPQGFGYYEFYSVATDSNNATESVVQVAQTSTHYSATPPYTTAAVVSLGNLAQAYDGSAHNATATTVPPGLAMNITYDGSAVPPVHGGTYSVVATVTQSGFTGSASGSLVIARATQSITFGALPAASVGTPVTLAATASSGLAITYQSDNPAVATVSGNTVTPVGPGTVNITANQAGNSDYLAADPVVQPLSINSADSNSSSDVPLPPWAIAVLALALGLSAVFFLRRKHGAATD